MIPRSRRLALGAAVLLVASSCGSAAVPGPVAGSGSASTGVTALDKAPVVIRVAAPGADDFVADASITAGGAASSESKMMVAMLDYVYGGEIVDLTSPAGSWFFPAGVTPTNDQVLALARAFGVQGEVREVSADLGGGWTVGADDYNLPSITVSPDATLGWWFNPGVVDQSVTAPCPFVDPTVPVDPAVGAGVEPGSAGADAWTTVAAGDCAEPAPPANVPSASEAEARATDLLVSLGLRPADYELETYADDWNAGVTAFLRLDGVRTRMSVNVGFGGDGVIAWAGGFLATPERGPDYPRIGIEASVQRLNDQNIGWFGGDPATLRAEGTPAAVPGDVTAAPSDQIDSIGPTETIEPRDFKPTTVTLTGPRPSLEEVWADDNTVWLLPGYLFDSADGGQYSVIAVEDRYIVVSDPPAGLPGPTAPPIDSPTPASAEAPPGSAAG